MAKFAVIVDGGGIGKKIHEDMKENKEYLKYVYKQNEWHIPKSCSSCYLSPINDGMAILSNTIRPRPIQIP